MRKVLLVIEEIQQLISLETFLRRLGFDVLSLSKDSLVSDAVLGFQPDIVLTSRNGRHIDGVQVSRKLKKTMTPPPRVAIVYSGAKPVLSSEEQRSIDALIEVPAAGETTIRLLAQLSGLSIEPLLEKFRRVESAKPVNEDTVVIVVGDKSTTHRHPNLEASTPRSKSYDTFLQNHATDLANGAADRVMPRGRAAELMAKLKEDSASEKEHLDEIQAQKIKFAEALFDDEKKKAKGP